MTSLRAKCLPAFFILAPSSKSGIRRVPPSLSRRVFGILHGLVFHWGGIEGGGGGEPKQGHRYHLQVVIRPVKGKRELSTRVNRESTGGGVTRDIVVALPRGEKKMPRFVGEPFSDCFVAFPLESKERVTNRLRLGQRISFGLGKWKMKRRGWRFSFGGAIRMGRFCFIISLEFEFFNFSYL